MPLSIKNEATESLARRVARETGESLTEAIQTALQERWERLRQKRRGHLVADQIQDILLRVDTLPRKDSRPEDEILGYDEHGIPR